MTSSAPTVRWSRAVGSSAAGAKTTTRPRGAQTSSSPTGASSIEQERQAELFDPIEQGIIGWDKIDELGEILDGSFPGRTNDEQITYHANNNGTAAADLAIAQWVYEQCRQRAAASDRIAASRRAVRRRDACACAKRRVSI